MQLIEINLVPQELQAVKREKKPMVTGAPSLKLIVGGGIALLVLLHGTLFAMAFLKQQKADALKREWESLQPQKQRLEQFDSQFASLSRAASMADMMAHSRIVWAPKLNALSDHVPEGLWFRELSVSPAAFVLHGTVGDTDLDEISLIKDFVDRLSKDPRFIDDFESFELQSVQKRTITYHDVTDFIMNGNLKQK